MDKWEWKEKSRQRQSVPGNRELYIHSLERLHQETQWEPCCLLVPDGRSLQLYSFAALLLKSLQRLPIVIRKPSQPALHYFLRSPCPTQNSCTAFSHSTTFFNHWRLLFFQNVSVFFLPLGFCTSCCCICSQCFPPHPTLIHIMSSQG